MTSRAHSEKDKYTIGDPFMQNKTRSLLEELESLYIERDRQHILESRANNAITNAIRVVEQISEQYDAEVSEALIRKMLNAIRLKDPKKFTRSLRKADANSRTNTKSSQETDE